MSALKEDEVFMCSLSCMRNSQSNDPNALASHIEKVETSEFIDLLLSRSQRQAVLTFGKFERHGRDCSGCRHKEQA